MPMAANMRHTLYVIIFEHDTHAGQAFDVALLATEPSLGSAEVLSAARVSLWNSIVV